MNTTNVTFFELDRDKEIFEIARQCMADDTFTIVTSVVVTTCFFPAVFGNIMIVVCYRKFRCFHGKAIYRYILNMAISDLMLVATMLMYPLQDIFPELAHYKYFCIGRFALVLWTVSSSVGFITAISIDRYLSIFYPLMHMVESQNKRLIWIVVVSIWTISFSVCFVQTFFNQLDDFDAYDKTLPCVNSVTVSDTWHFITDFSIIGSTVCDVIFYFIVMRSLRKAGQISSTVVSGNLSGNLCSTIAKTKLMILVFVTFVECWVPMIVVDLYFLFNKATASRAIICWRDYLFVLGVLQSCTNWIYYGIWNVHFRKAFKAVLSCKKGGAELSTNRNTTSS